MRTAPRLEDPEFYTDASVARHESAHIAANHVLGLSTASATLGDLEGCVLHVKTQDRFARVVGLLAGGAYERSIGQDGSAAFDVAEAKRVLAEQALRGAALDEAFALCSQAADGLVRSERFRRLVHALVQPLRIERHLGASRIREILETADRDVPSRIWHGRADPKANPLYEVTSRVHDDAQGGTVGARMTVPRGRFVGSPLMRTA